ncbi:hypothetical protein Fot_15112 [Forsythia ovata]|uniref:Uncharacterized protein n=1 Tax=Forsythia ovata TaxID=205694 RepID=A0ABD1W884_9LAMI
MKKCPVRDVDDVDSEEVLILTLLTVVSSLGRSHQLFGSSGDRFEVLQEELHQEELCHQCCESLTASESGKTIDQLHFTLILSISCTSILNARMQQQHFSVVWEGHRCLDTSEEPLMIQLNDDSKIESHPGATVLQSPVQHDVNVADKVRASNCGPPGKEQQTCYTQTAIN